MQTEAFVLVKRAPAEAFQSFELFSAEAGALRAMQRISRKAAGGSVALDLFDEADLRLESGNQGRTWFVREVRLIERPVGIGRSYEALLFASRLAAVAARNPVHEDSRVAVAELLRSAFAAFGSGSRPDIVYLKSIYRFARDEGYPVKQEWLPSLPAAERALCLPLMNRPLGEQTASAGEVGRIVRLLEAYLRGHTDILID